MRRKKAALQEHAARLLERATDSRLSEFERQRARDALLQGPERELRQMEIAARLTERRLAELRILAESRWREQDVEEREPCGRLPVVVACALLALMALLYGLGDLAYAHFVRTLVNET